MLPLFAAAISAGALLLFLVQPMVARMHLPGLGGSPAVWNTCMLFFQGALLAGYAWAHVGARLLGGRAHTVAHVLLLAGGAAALWRWSAPPDPPAEASVTAWLLATLALTIGLPFVAVSATAPLLQRWFSATDHPAARDPYFLYAASNAGSLAALVGYPLVLEWAAGLQAQRLIWSIGYIVLAALIVVCALVSIRRAAPPSPHHPITPSPHRDTVAKSRTGHASPHHPITAPPALTTPVRLLWVALAAVPSSLMLGATQYVSTDIAAVPLLWVVPLALYLITYIVAFLGRPVPLRLLSRLLPIMAIALVICLMLQAKHPIWVLILVHLSTFFVAALVCHARLAILRPAPEHLTEFYLLIAVGGVLGGIFNALVAPLVFTSIAEYPIALVLACMLRPGALRDQGASNRRAIWSAALDLVIPALILALALLSEGLVASGEEQGRLSASAAESASLLLTVGLPALLAYLTIGRPLRFALSLGALLLMAHSRAVPIGDVLKRDRTFFGVYTVTRSDRSTVLYHGTTMHGAQFVDAERKAIPLSYYHPEGPIGQVFKAFGSSPLFDRVGLIGLGSGSLAAYGRPGQRMTFFEIDPAVAAIARDPRLFTYLSESPAKPDPEIILGDARVSLKNRVPEGEFGLLVVDAFTSDAIPVHLVTREAVALYVSRLRPGGLIAFHISNQYMDLAPVIARIASDLGLVAIANRDDVAREEAVKEGRSGSTWVVLARNRADLGPLARDSRWSELLAGRGAPLWTDDYSNIFTVFKWD